MSEYVVEPEAVLVTASGISANKHSDDPDRQHTPRDIRRRAMDLLARREHSRMELARKLHRRFSDFDIIESCLDKLVEDRLLSDERFTEAYVNYRRKAGFGPKRIAMELRERGVSDAILRRAITNDARIWFETAAIAKSKKFGPQKPSTINEKVRQQRFLSYRGFSSEHYNELLG